MKLGLEFLYGHPRGAWKEQDIPILIPHACVRQGGGPGHRNTRWHAFAENETDGSARLPEPIRQAGAPPYVGSTRRILRVKIVASTNLEGARSGSRPQFVLEWQVRAEV